MFLTVYYKQRLHHKKQRLHRKIKEAKAEGIAEGKVQSIAEGKAEERDL